jgi:hypothetical protein
MAAVTGLANSFNVAVPIGARYLTIRFIPISYQDDRNTVGVMGDYLFFPEPVEVEVAANATPSGSWTASLAVTDEMEGIKGYLIELGWTNRRGKPLGRATVNGLLHVPNGGGAIRDLLDAPPPPGSIILALGPPPAGITDVAWVDLLDGVGGPLIYGPFGPELIEA